METDERALEKSQVHVYPSKRVTDVFLRGKPGIKTRTDKFSAVRQEVVVHTPLSADYFYSKILNKLLARQLANSLLTSTMFP